MSVDEAWDKEMYVVVEILETVLLVMAQGWAERCGVIREGVQCGRRQSHWRMRRALYLRMVGVGAE